MYDKYVFTGNGEIKVYSSYVPLHFKNMHIVSITGKTLILRIGLKLYEFKNQTYVPEDDYWYDEGYICDCKKCRKATKGYDNIKGISYIFYSDMEDDIIYMTMPNFDGKGRIDYVDTDLFEVAKDVEIYVPDGKCSYKKLETEENKSILMSLRKWVFQQNSFHMNAFVWYDNEGKVSKILLPEVLRGEKYEEKDWVKEGYICGCEDCLRELEGYDTLKGMYGIAIHDLELSITIPLFDKTEFYSSGCVSMQGNAEIYILEQNESGQCVVRKLKREENDTALMQFERIIESDEKVSGFLWFDEMGKVERIVIPRVIKTK